MARKKKEVNQTNELPRLSVEDYWKWRNCISEMWLEEKKLKIKDLELKLKEKSTECEQVKIALGKATILQQAKDSHEEARKAYNDLKAELEQKLGCSLSGKVIDEFTLEVKDLPAEN